MIPTHECLPSSSCFYEPKEKKTEKFENESVSSRTWNSRTWTKTTEPDEVSVTSAILANVEEPKSRSQEQRNPLTAFKSVTSLTTLPSNQQQQQQQPNTSPESESHEDHHLVRPTSVKCHLKKGKRRVGKNCISILKFR